VGASSRGQSAGTDNLGDAFYFSRSRFAAHTNNAVNYCKSHDEQSVPYELRFTPWLDNRAANCVTASSRQLQAASLRNSGGTSGRGWLEAFGWTAADGAIGLVPPPVVTAPVPSPRGSRVARLLPLLCL